MARFNQHPMRLFLWDEKVRCRSTPRLLRQAITLRDVWLAAQHEVSRPDIKAVLVVRIDTKKCR
ncbi:hypothetical protein I7I53_11669 [Histoplasma capsulatum var. duboisii H88]|uniref:Uncharacterized protein n=1 Tax=Ajellomyces capsulatus (strain H88) TaxID=544711 RepID=A0A8A1LZV8_AJEC8|nr:hypothetical protein I7I53_11669 [Histoplasma capsulatum var. duboisii H88]